MKRLDDLDRYGVGVAGTIAGKWREYRARREANSLRIYRMLRERSR